MNRSDRRAARSRDEKKAIERRQAVMLREDALRRADPQAYFARRVEAEQRYGAMESVMAKHIDEAVRRGYDEGAKSATESTGQTYIAAMCLALNELYGFGPKRYSAVTDRMFGILMECISSQEVVQRAKEKLGITLSMSDPMGWIQFDDE